MRTEKQIIEDANLLSMKFYNYFGYKLKIKNKKFFRFDKSQNFKEQEMWNLAAIAYEFIEGTDIKDTLNNI